MNTDNFHKLLDFAYIGGGLVPVNQPAMDLINITKPNETLSFIEATNRDLKFHRAYFALLNFIWGYMPDKFKANISKDKFYKWLQHLKGEYEVLFTFKDGTTLVEYDSIAFGRMSQKTFQAYVLSQLPFIYENIIGVYFDGDDYNNIIDTIEQEFEKFLSKL